MTIAIYPGSFDPVTLGHMNMIKRASRCFDKVIVYVGRNSAKQGGLFTPDERVEMLRRCVTRFPNVEVDCSDELLAAYAKRVGAKVLVKGLRAVSDYEYEVQMAVINRKNAAGEERLFLICRTYQRFTKAGVCTCHSIKEKTVTDAVLAKVREVCEAYMNPEELMPIAQAAVSEADKAASAEAEIQSLRNRIDTLTVNLDKMYMDKLSGILSEADFQRIYLKVKDDRAQLEEQLKTLEKEKENPIPKEDRAKELVQRFLESVPTNRELLFSLIERVELSEDKQIYIKFRFRQLNEAG